MDSKVADLEKEYHLEGVADGTQWVLLLQQGNHTRRIYCNNQFPDEIRSLADRLDRIVDLIPEPKFQWKDVSFEEARADQARLWTSGG